MNKSLLIIFSALAMLVSGCGTGIKEDRVKQEAQRSFDITLAYINQERDLHQFDLNRKIRLTEDKIKRIEGKAQSEQGSSDNLDDLKDEKAGYERKLKILLANTDASTKKIKDRWVHYNQSLDAMLQNMDDYLKGIPIDIDTLPKKDTIRRQ